MLDPQVTLEARGPSPGPQGLGCPPENNLGASLGKKGAQPLPGARPSLPVGQVCEQVSPSWLRLGRPRVCESRAQPWPGQWSEHLTYLLCPGTGRGKDIPASGDEDASTRSAARPALAQCQALSVDWAGPGSPHRLYVTVQVSTGACRNVRG